MNRERGPQARWAGSARAGGPEAERNTLLDYVCLLKGQTSDLRQQRGRKGMKTSGHILVIRVLVSNGSPRVGENHAKEPAQSRKCWLDVGLCSVSIQSRETCEHLLRAAGGMAAVPNEAPTVVLSYVVPDTKLDGGSTAHGGRVLILKGTNGLGQPYRMEYVVFDKGNNHLVSLVAPYWFNSSFTRVGPEGWGTTSGPPPPIP